MKKLYSANVGVTLNIHRDNTIEEILVYYSIASKSGFTLEQLEQVVNDYFKNSLEISIEGLGDSVAQRLDAECSLINLDYCAGYDIYIDNNGLEGQLSFFN